MIVFVHGVPETADIWNKLRAALDRESCALSLPGFGCPRPVGFGATKDDYVNWLRHELERIDGPVDLVGHDWGAAFTYRIATAYGGLVRSWVADVANCVHPSYQWHDWAKILQTPGAGEKFFEEQALVAVEERALVFESMGVPPEDALALAASADDTMASCILDLYRCAMPNARGDWRDGWAPTAARGLVLNPTEDVAGDEAMATEVASVLGAEFITLQGLGHWWALQDPDAAASVLDRFWSASE